LARAGLLCWLVSTGCSPPERVDRQHRDGVADAFVPLTRRIEFSFPGNAWLTRREAEEDLDELEWLLEHRYAYLTLRSVDYRAALDSIRAALPDRIARGTFALQLHKLLALFGDGHTLVSDPALETMRGRFLPFLVAESQGRLVAFSGDRKSFLDEQHPFLRKLDGRLLEEWLQVARPTVARGSPQFSRRACLGRLRDIEYLRKELLLPPSDCVQVELESADGASRHTLNLPLSNQRHTSRTGRPGGSDALPLARILPGEIGYLQIYPWLSDSPQFLEGLVSAMGTLRDTRGLVIDLRGNGGGSRAPLRTLFPFFLAPNAPPQVLNVAAYRVGHAYNVLEGRWLYPADWDGWSQAERAAIQTFARGFVPAWPLPCGQFSEWHYFVLSPSTRPECYHYRQPVIILMDSANFSATDIFLGAFKGRHNVTLMGTPSGGGSGRFQSFRLRHSSIQVHLSSMVSFQPGGALYDGNGIQPDVLLEPTSEDLIGKTDSVLDAARRKLRTGRDHE